MCVWCVSVGVYVPVFPWILNIVQTYPMLCRGMGLCLWYNYTSCIPLVIAFVLQNSVIESSRRYLLIENAKREAFRASSSKIAPYRSRLYYKGISPTYWSARRNEPNEWIQINFESPKLISMIIIAPSHDGKNYIKYFTVFCGLDDFVVRELSKFRLRRPEITSFNIGVRYCRTVRLVVHEWENAIDLRWSIVQASGMNSSCNSSGQTCKCTEQALPYWTDPYGPVQLGSRRAGQKCVWACVQLPPYSSIIKPAD